MTNKWTLICVAEVHYFVLRGAADFVFCVASNRGPSPIPWKLCQQSCRCGERNHLPLWECMYLCLCANSFCALIAAASISPFGQLFIPAGYVITGRASVLMAWTLLPCLTLCRYLPDFLVVSLWFPFACRIPRYLQLTWTSAMLPPVSSDHLPAPWYHPTTLF